MQIITRMQAAKEGLNKYNTGKPCLNGHRSPRYVHNGTCVQCALESANKHRNKFAEALRAAQGAA